MDKVNIFKYSSIAHPSMTAFFALLIMELNSKLSTTSTTIALLIESIKIESCH